MATLLMGVACHLGCSSNDTNQALDQSSGGYGGNTITGLAGTRTTSSIGGTVGNTGVGGTQTVALGGSRATTNAAGKGGSAGKSVTAGSSGASGKINSAAGKSAAGTAGLAGAAGKAGQTNTAGSGGDACGADAKTVTGNTSKTGNGSVLLFTSGDNEILSFTMTMIVPAKPQPATNTLFLWPGLQPSSSGGMNGFGVLQPVLTWGGSCNGNYSPSDGWWISGQYVYFAGLGAQCEGGDIMMVKTGDKLDIEFILNGTVWTQIITNQSSGKSVKFDRDLKGQKQVEVLYEIEQPTSTKPSDDVIFTSSVIKFSKSAPNSCVPTSQGTSDYYSPVRVSSDGKTCCISKVILRSAGVAPTSPNEP